MIIWWTTIVGTKCSSISNYHRLLLCLKSIDVTLCIFMYCTLNFRFPYGIPGLFNYLHVSEFQNKCCSISVKFYYCWNYNQLVRFRSQDRATRKIYIICIGINICGITENRYFYERVNRALIPGELNW